MCGYLNFSRKEDREREFPFFLFFSSLMFDQTSFIVHPFRAKCINLMKQIT